MDITIREACRKRIPLSGVDAQALEGGLQQTERELTTITRERGNYKTIVTDMSEDEKKVRDILAAYDKSDSYVVEPLHELAGRITEENAKLRAALEEIAKYHGEYTTVQIARNAIGGK